MEIFDVRKFQISPGERVKLLDPGITVTVRKLRQVAVGANGKVRHVIEALVDDGEMTDPNLETNGFHVARWVEGHELEVI